MTLGRHPGFGGWETRCLLSDKSQLVDQFTDSPVREMPYIIHDVDHSLGIDPLESNDNAGHERDPYLQLVSEKANSEICFSAQYVDWVNQAFVVLDQGLEACGGDRVPVLEKTGQTLVYEVENAVVPRNYAEKPAGDPAESTNGQAFAPLETLANMVNRVYDGIESLPTNQLQ